MRTALYRLYGADEALLYVGNTGNPDRRFEEHDDSKPWWGEVVTTTVEWFPNVEAAAEAEAAAIYTAQPPRNIRSKNTSPEEAANLAAERQTIRDLLDVPPDVLIERARTRGGWLHDSY